MKDHLIFDTTDAQSIADTDSVGAYVRAADGTLITHTTNGGKDGLDVNLINTSIVVTATDLDIRNLTFAQDKVDVSDSTNVAVTDGGGSLTVDAVDLDIRNLNHSADNVAIASGGNELLVNADGSINVNAEISVVTGSDKVEDSAHASGDIGAYVLAVRQDTLASSTDADGDYASLKVNSAGALYTTITNSLTVNDAALANVAIANASKTLAVANTAEAMVTAALTSRKYLYVYNNDNTKIFVGGASVSAANGFPLSPGSYMELRAGAAVSPFYVGQSGKTPEIRTMELS